MVLSQLLPKIRSSAVVVNLERITQPVTDFIRGNPIVSTAVLGAGVTGLATATTIISKHRKAKKKTTAKRRRKTTTKKRKNKSKNGRKRRKRFTPRTAGKRKDRSTRRIRQTKNGQPYIILANGRARFISKKSARRSRKLKGGRY